jgi:mRNA-degrading endonuclease toxin of MazEF toxin-antitoxin module
MSWQTVARTRIGARITQLGPVRMEEIRRAIGFAIDL